MDDRLVWTEDLGALRHEIHTAKDDNIGVDLGGGYRESQGISHVICHILNFRNDVIVGQYHSILLVLQFLNPFEDVHGTPKCGSLY